MTETNGQWQIDRRSLLRAGGAAGLFLLGGAGCGAADSSGAPPDVPNVVLVIVDSLRPDHIGAYGGRRARTPNIDAFARQSLTFERGRPESLPTIPARRAMMTGERIFPFRGWQQWRGLPDTPGFAPIAQNQITWPELLRRRGYVSAYVTDNPHIISGPYDRFRERFDQSRDVVGQVPLRPGNSAKRVISERQAFRWTPREARGVEGDRIQQFLSLNRPGMPEQEFLTAKVFRQAMGFLDDVGRRKPFALTIDCFDVHEPWYPPPRYLRMYTDDADGPQPIQPFATPAGAAGDLRRGTLERMRALYAAEVSFYDAWFGKFLDKLAALGLDESTYVLFVSDHGVMLGEHGVVGKSKSNLHRELYRIPFMIRHPAGVKAGARSNYMAQTHDVGPTLVSAAGVKPPAGMNGQDLTVIFAGDKPRRKRPHYTAALDDWVVCVTDDWAMMCQNQGGEAKLYDMRRDPAQTRDVASRHPDVVRRMYRRIVADAGGPLPKF